MSARERILGRISAARATATGAGDSAHPLPPERRGPPTAPDPVRCFIERARRLGSEVQEVETEAAFPAAVARYLHERALARRSVIWPALADRDWAGGGVEIEARAARGSDTVGITGAFAGIAETGTLMLLSGADTPASVSLLPETHIALLRADQIVPAMEDAWARLRQRHGSLPRAVNFVSGPSRTADVEQTITVGAHGPRRVLIVLAAG